MSQLPESSTAVAAHSDAVLLPSEAAKHLGISESELLAAASSGAVPGACLGGRWRFGKRAIERCRSTWVRALTP